MDRTKESGPLLCAQMPEAAEILTSERFMPKLPDEVRQKIKGTILEIEGSPQDGGMTCIAVKDFPALSDKIYEGIQKGQLMDGYTLNYRDQLQGFVRNLNRHCEECSTVCSDRIGLTRQQLQQLSVTTGYTNSRRAKVNPPVYEDIVA